MRYVHPLDEYHERLGSYQPSVWQQDRVWQRCRYDESPQNCLGKWVGSAQLLIEIEHVNQGGNQRIQSLVHA